MSDKAFTVQKIVGGRISHTRYRVTNEKSNRFFEITSLPPVFSTASAYEDFLNGK